MALGFSRSHVEMVNEKKVFSMYDYAFGEYLATKSFFELLSEVQNNLVTTGKVVIQTGQEVDAQSPGGLIAIQLYMDTLESSRQTMSGLAKLGLNVEKQIWKLQ